MGRSGFEASVNQNVFACVAEWTWFQCCQTSWAAHRERKSHASSSRCSGWVYMHYLCIVNNALASSWHCSEGVVCIICAFFRVSAFPYRPFHNDDCYIVQHSLMYVLVLLLVTAFGDPHPLLQKVSQVVQWSVNKQLITFSLPHLLPPPPHHVSLIVITSTWAQNKGPDDASKWKLET